MIPYKTQDENLNHWVPQAPQGSGGTVKVPALGYQGPATTQLMSKSTTLPGASMVPTAILIYIAALCCANLLAHHFGPSATPWIALTLVGLDLSIRDWLNVTIPRWGMAILIPAAGAVAYSLDPSVKFIAVASVISFVVAEWVEWGCFQAAEGSWFKRAVKANTAAAAVDSLLFPALAFHAFLPWITLAHFAAKTIGSTVWAYGLQHIPMRRRG